MKEIKVGQEWITRGGLNMTIISIEESNTSYPVWAKVTDGESHFSYTLAGKYYTDESNDIDNDLFELIEEEIVPSTKKPPSVFKVGQRWLTRDGRIATITSVDEDRHHHVLNYPIFAEMENEITGGTMGNSYTIDGCYYSNNATSEHAFDLMELIEEEVLVTQPYEATTTEEVVMANDFYSQKHLWTKLIEGGFVRSKSSEQVFGFHEGTIRVFNDIDAPEDFYVGMQFSYMDDWESYEFPVKAVWIPRKPTLCWVTDSEIANPAYSYDVEFICDYEDGLYINTDEGRTWKYATPLTMAEVATYLDECE